MRKILLGILIGLVILGLAGPTAADPKKEKEPVDRITFIHYRDGRVRVEGRPAPAKGGPTCYKLLGVKWATTTSFVINPNDYDENFVVSAIASSTEEWDKNTSFTLFSGYTTSSSASVDQSQPNYQNEYVFGDYGNENVIAVTYIWYTRYSKKIVDYDVLFNDKFYDWADCKDKEEYCKTNNLMDLQNIATHETGHGLGLGDVYQSACSEMTMYGYSDYGETKKRTLETPDITALQKLYGP